MGTIPIPQEILDQADRLVTGALTGGVQLKCTELRADVVTATAALLVQKPESLRSRSLEKIAKRCAHLANVAYEKAMGEPHEGENVIRNARDHFRTQVFTRSFP
jgi:hypothetical protein